MSWPANPPAGWPFAPWPAGTSWPPPAPPGFPAGITWEPPPASWGIGALADWAYTFLPAPAGTDIATTSAQILSAHGTEFPPGTRILFASGGTICVAEMPMPNGQVVYIDRVSGKVIPQNSVNGGMIKRLFQNAPVVQQVAPYGPVHIPEPTGTLTDAEISAAIKAARDQVGGYRSLGIVKVATIGATLNGTAIAGAIFQWEAGVEKCSDTKVRLTPMLNQFIRLFQFQHQGYTFLSNRLTELNNCPNQSQTFRGILANARTRMNNALSVISDRIDEAVYTKNLWAGWNCNVADLRTHLCAVSHTPKDARTDGDPCGPHSITRLTDLYNDGVETFNGWQKALNYLKDSWCAGDPASYSQGWVASWGVSNPSPIEEDYTPDTPYDNGEGDLTEDFVDVDTSELEEFIEEQEEEDEWAGPPIPEPS